MISNQVIDLSAFESGEEGNIAIQALDSVSGHNFGKQKVARKALHGGELSAKDLFQNMSAYNLIRHEGKEYKTGVAMLDALLEDAVILPKEEATLLTEYMLTFPQDTLLEKFEDRERTLTRGKKFFVDMYYSDFGHDIIISGFPQELINDPNHPDYAEITSLTLKVDYYKYKNYIASYKDENNSSDKIFKNLTQVQFDDAISKTKGYLKHPPVPTVL